MVEVGWVGGREGGREQVSQQFYWILYYKAVAYMHVQSVYLTREEEVMTQFNTRIQSPYQLAFHSFDNCK